MLVTIDLLVSILCKELESIVRERILHMQKKNLLSKTHFGVFT